MPRLVAVSKKQPVEKIVWAYRQGLRHFGENYVSHVVFIWYFIYMFWT